MGCDIHCFKEKQINGKWVTADTWESDTDENGNAYAFIPLDKTFTQRNYELFGMLSKGVRTRQTLSFAPRGTPVDVCPEAASEIAAWGHNGYGHSYLYLHELKDLLANTKKTTIKITGMKEADSLKAFQDSIASGTPDWELLFPYCKWGNSSNLVSFEQDVPADFYVGGALTELIRSFDGVDGDNHRVVFFFDN